MFNIYELYMIIYFSDRDRNKHDAEVGVRFLTLASESVSKGLFHIFKEYAIFNLLWIKI